ncbi:hypothetical protein [Sphingobacterium multivorum]|uniref:hypothetical protein n=1 Tax=Sphingobacterium multivorum TaxID=28454 RepID=UPI0031BBCBF1
MTTLSFQIESPEVKKIKAVLKALGGTKIKIESDDEFSKLNDRVKEARAEKERGESNQVFKIFWR